MGVVFKQKSGATPGCTNSNNYMTILFSNVCSSLQHENLVCLRGVVIEPETFKIVTEYMSKGSLLEYLRSRGRQYVTKTYQIKFAL